ncbi:hypothetical protein [Inquilinus limosus]|uniref:Uncharacterized protein n=1 Tax=Inquilinus limosus MP06 TaxID=1398085 RepID=A0A0A0DCS8_9PROT|nr:hypothetical protein [Inquilinus limosus]KGM35909.1 hypothetical protein P409_01655 [Inquilinus limosus MP06]
MTSTDRNRPQRGFALPLDRVIGVIQIVGGIVGLTEIGERIYRDGAAIIAATQWLVMLGAALLMVLCIVAGALLWKRRGLGYALSLLVQAVQIPIVYAGGVAYHFHMIARLPLTVVADGGAMSITPAYGIGLDSFQGALSLGFYLDTGLAGTIIAVNLLPLVLCIILELFRERNRSTG